VWAVCRAWFIRLKTLVRSSPANAMMFLLRLGVLFYALAFVSQLM